VNTPAFKEYDGTVVLCRTGRHAMLENDSEKGSLHGGDVRALRRDASLGTRGI